MSSLQEQLLKAGLTTKDKATKAKSDKRKQDKINRKHKIDTVDENKLAAEQALAEKAEKARLLNQQQKAVADQKALIAQVKQLIEVNQQALGKPSVTYSFSDNGSIKRLQVSNDVHKHISNGLLAIVRSGSQYALVAKTVAEKIKQRATEFVVILNEKVEQSIDEDDPYADFQIPDDLMW